MKNLSSSKNKIQEICDLLKRDTLEPAREEASRLLQEAEDKARQITEKAHKQADEILGQARSKAQQEQEVFQGNLKQAAKQGLEALRQSIEKELFVDQLQTEVKNALKDDAVVAKLIEALVHAVEKDGLKTSLEVYVPKACSAKDIASKVSQELMKKLEQNALKLGSFSGGVQLKLKDQNLTLDFSDESLIEILVTYVRKDFRELFFK